MDLDLRRADTSAATKGYGGKAMRGNEAHKLTPQDPIDGSFMEARVARIESDVAKIQVDVRDLRTDMRAANDSIADVRVAITALDGKIDALSERVDGKIDALSQSVDGRINALSEKVDGRMNTLSDRIDANTESIRKLEAKVDGNHLFLRASLTEMGKNVSDIRESIAVLREGIGDLKGSQRMLVLFLIGTGALGVIAKIFHWL
jgi:chromosome segregation ATPase